MPVIIAEDIKDNSYNRCLFELWTFLAALLIHIFL